MLERYISINILHAAWHSVYILHQSKLLAHASDRLTEKVKDSARIKDGDDAVEYREGNKRCGVVEACV